MGRQILVITGSHSAALNGYAVRTVVSSVIGYKSSNSPKFCSIPP